MVYVVFLVSGFNQPALAEGAFLLLLDNHKLDIREGVATLCAVYPCPPLPLMMSHDFRVFFSVLFSIIPVSVLIVGVPIS